MSRDRIDRLGFFESVNIETPAVPSAPDQVDVNVTVKERATGNIQLGAGYSSTEGLVLTAGLSQQNLFGSGNALSLEINTSKANRVIAITHTDPYVTTEGISRTVELFDRRSNLAELGLSSVGYSTRGLGLVYGVPFTEYDRVFFGLRWENTTIDLTDSSPIRYVEYVRQFGENTDTLAFTTGWSRDNRDNLLVPQRGNYQRAFAEVGLPVLDLQYYRLSYQYQQFWPLFSKVTLAMNTEVGYGNGYSGDPYPFFKNFYVGGIGSVRGYEGGSLGPTRPLRQPAGRQPQVQRVVRNVDAAAWRRPHAPRTGVLRHGPGLGADGAVPGRLDSDLLRDVDGGLPDHRQPGLQEPADRPRRPAVLGRHRHRVDFPARPAEAVVRVSDQQSSRATDCSASSSRSERGSDMAESCASKESGR